MSFRRICNGGRLLNVSKFPSLKMRRNVLSESILENDFIHHLEHDSNVISYKEQATRIFFELDGKRRYYTPDFLVVRRIGKPQIIEVKLREKISQWFLQLYRIITPICEREGFEFVVSTELEIRTPFLGNIKCLWKYARTPLYPFHQVLCYELFGTRSTASLEDVFEFFANRGVHKQVVLALLYFGIISTDLSVPLGPSSPIRYDAMTASDKEAA